MEYGCINTLFLDGKALEIERFLEQSRNIYSIDEENRIETALSFEKFVPIPADLRFSNTISANKEAELILKYGFADWHDWCQENWGVDGDVEVIDYDKSKKAFSDFVTSHPPIKIIKVLSRNYSSIQFTLELFNFEHQDEDIATRVILSFKNGDMQTKESSKVRCKFCENCRQITGFREL